jgi:pimeloyl-[acyl-carrier protein] methyl ester esterase
MKSGPVLLISGWAHGEEALRPVAEAVAGRGPGMSLSLASLGPAHDAEEGISSYARTVSSHLDLWGEPAWVVGWSTGGVVALETAARYPEKVAGLVLLSATARFCSDDAYTSGVKPAVLRAMLRGLRKDPRAVVSDFISRALHPLSLRQDVLAGRTQAALAAGTETLSRGLEYLAAADLRPDLASIALPCLIIHGMQDRIVPLEAGRYLHSNLPLSRIEPLPSAGHCLVEQCGDGIIRLISQFLEHP